MIWRVFVDDGENGARGQFFPHFALIYRTIIVNVCFVLLARSEDQIEQFEVDSRNMSHIPRISVMRMRTMCIVLLCALIDALCQVCR
jgi:hypothetical protein